MLAAGPGVPVVHRQAVGAAVDLGGPDLDQLQQARLQAAGPDRTLQPHHGFRPGGELLVVVAPHRCRSSFPALPACVPRGPAPGAAFCIQAFLTPAGACGSWRGGRPFPVTPGAPRAGLLTAGTAARLRSARTPDPPPCSRACVRTQADAASRSLQVPCKPADRRWGEVPWTEVTPMSAEQQHLGSGPVLAGGEGDDLEL